MEIIIRFCLFILSVCMIFFLSGVHHYGNKNNVYNCLKLKIIIAFCVISTFFNMIYYGELLASFMNILSFTLLMIYAVLLHVFVIFKK